MLVQDIVKDLQQSAAQPELDLMSTQTHSSMSGEYSPMSMVASHPLQSTGKSKHVDFELVCLVLLRC